MLAILQQVNDLKQKESELQAERQRHLDQIAQSETDLKRTNDDLKQAHEDGLRLKDHLTALRDELFPQEEVAPPIVEADDDGKLMTDLAAKRMWNEMKKKAANA
jgi:predicted nuclease with TOPRIM domain